MCINKSFVWAIHCSHLTISCLNTVSVCLLHELLFAKFGYFSDQCLSQAEVAYAILLLLLLLLVCVS